MRSLAALLLSCACVDAWSSAARPQLSSPRPARAASILADASLLQKIPGLVAEDMFGSVFMAGMSIAAAGVGTTVFAAFIVNGRYDEIEASMFEAQDRDVAKQKAQQVGVEDDVRDFFGDINPQMSQPATGTPTIADSKEQVKS